MNLFNTDQLDLLFCSNVERLKGPTDLDNIFRQ